MKKCIRKNNRGFTLIEIIVSLGIFSVAVMIGVGALLSVNDANRKARSLRVAMDNLNFAIEDMARNIRTGAAYYCPVDAQQQSNLISSPARLSLGGNQDCPGGQTAISILAKGKDPKETTFIYYLSSGWINVVEIDQNGTVQGPFPLTSPQELKIKDLKFYVEGSSDLRKKPKVIISITGETLLTPEKTKTSFSVQTMVSKRVFE